jgi:hypothetical protein
MMYSEEQVEWIVAEVIRRLGLLGATGDRSSASQAGGELALAERVVTMRSVEGRLNGVSRLRVQRRAVITPAVKDELKERKIEIVFQ